MIINDNMRWMTKAIDQANYALKKDEVPIGAVIVKDNKIIGKGYNQVESLKDSTAHAEILAIKKATIILKNKYLIGCSLYVTLEPCPMCAGAIIQSRISQVVYGAKDPKGGACGSKVNLFKPGLFNHDVCISYEKHQQSEHILKTFFKALRKKE